MRAFSYAWSLPVIRQRWRSHRSINHSQNPHSAAKFMILCSIEPQLWKLYIARMKIFDLYCSCDLDLDPIIFIYEWPVFTGDTPDVHILTSHVETFGSYHLADRQTDRQTDSTKIIYHAASRVVNKNICKNNTVAFLLRWTNQRFFDSCKIILPRCMECRRGLAMRILSVCPSVCLSVRLSVRHTRELWQNGRKICPDLYTIWKNI